MRIRLVEYDGGWIARDGAQAYFFAETCQALEAPDHLSDARVCSTLRTLHAWPLGYTQAEAASMLRAMLAGGIGA